MPYQTYQRPRNWQFNYSRPWSRTPPQQHQRRYGTTFHREYEQEDNYGGYHLHSTKSTTTITSPSWITEKKRQRRNKYTMKIRALKQLVADKDKLWEEHRFKLTLKECSKFSTQTLREMKSDLLKCYQVIDETLHDREDREKMCSICFGSKRQVLFMPCRHFLSCEECSHNVENCPICRQYVEKRIKIFLS